MIRAESERLRDAAMLDRAVDAYLGINAAGLLGIAAWCAARPEQTAEAIGYELRGPSGHSEYQTFYGGLQAGLGVLFALGAVNRRYRDAALIGAACAYGGIMLGRGPSFVQFPGTSSTTKGFGALEFVMGAAAFAFRGFAEARVESRGRIQECLRL